MKIAIFGSGGVGGYFGARLAAAGEDVHFIARGRHLDAIRSAGLKIRSPLGDVLIDPAQATGDAAAVGAADVVIVAVKLYDTEAAAEACKPLVGPASWVLSLQNGVTAADVLVTAFGRDRVVGGSSSIAARIEAPGVIVQTGTMATLAFGEWDGGPTPRTEALHQACGKAGIDAAHVTFVPVDFRREDAFEKLRKAGYDPAKKTLFLWEGVTLYLAEEDVGRTLRDVRKHAAPGSLVVADFYAERFIRMGSGSLTKKMLEYTDEALGFGLPFATDFEQVLQRFLESEEMKPGETFFFGSAGKKGPFMVVAEFGV